MRGKACGASLGRERLSPMMTTTPGYLQPVHLQISDTTTAALPPRRSKPPGRVLAVGKVRLAAMMRRDKDVARHPAFEDLLHFPD